MVLRTTLVNSKSMTDLLFTVHSNVLLCFPSQTQTFDLLDLTLNFPCFLYFLNFNLRAPNLLPPTSSNQAQSPLYSFPPGLWLIKSKLCEQLLTWQFPKSFFEWRHHQVQDTDSVRSNWLVSRVSDRNLPYLALYTSWQLPYFPAQPTKFASLGYLPRFSEGTIFTVSRSLGLTDEDERSLKGRTALFRGLPREAGDLLSRQMLSREGFFESHEPLGLHVLAVCSHLASCHRVYSTHQSLSIQGFDTMTNLKILQVYQTNELMASQTSQYTSCSCIAIESFFQYTSTEGKYSQSRPD